MAQNTLLLAIMGNTERTGVIRIYAHNMGVYMQRLSIRLPRCGISFCWLHMPNKTRFLMTLMIWYYNAVVWLIYLFIITVTNFSVFYFYYYCLLKSENYLCSFHMRTILPSPVTLISMILAGLITLPLKCGSNVVSKWHPKWRKFIPTCTCSLSATWKTKLVVKDFFCLILIHRSSGWHEISVFEKKSMMW